MKGKRKYPFIHVVRKKTGEAVKHLLAGKSIILNGANNIGKDTFCLDVMEALNNKNWKDVKQVADEGKKPKFKTSSKAGAVEKEKGDLYCFLNMPEDKDKIGMMKSIYANKGKQDGKLAMLIQLNEDFLCEIENGRQKDLLADIRELMSASVPNVTIVLTSRRRLLSLFPEPCEETVVRMSLGGFTKSEKQSFFNKLEKEKMCRNIDADMWGSLKAVIEKYAGTHPYLLNSARDILIDLHQRKEEISAQRLEAEILQKLEQGKDSNFGRVYYRLDEDLLGKEYYKVGKKKMSGRKLFIQAFSEKSGFSAEEKLEWQTLLCNDGYALEEDGTFKPLSPYMVEFLDKWSKKETKRLMTKCDKVELAIRKLLTERLVELKGSYAEAEAYLEELLRKITDNKAANYVKFSKMEFELNETKPDKEELLALVTLSFDDYLEIMKETWEFPHFPHFPVYGEYVSLLEGLNNKLFEPLVWGDALKRIGELIEKEEPLTLDEADCLKKEWNSIFNSLETWKGNLKEGADECFVLSNKLCILASETERNIANDKGEFLSDELIAKIKKIQRILQYIEEYSKDKDIIEAAGNLLQKMQSKEFVALLESKRKNELSAAFREKKLVEGCSAMNKCMFPNFVIVEFGSDKEYENQVKAAKNALSKLFELLKSQVKDENWKKDYDKAKNELTQFYDNVCRLQKKVKEKGIGRRISLTRVRNVAAHRHNLEVLNVRRYTGMLKECDMLLKDIKEGKVLQIPKIRTNCASFCIKQDSTLEEEEWIEGEFLYSKKEMEEKYPKITGWIEKSSLNSKTEFPVTSLEWVWNPKRNAFEVEIVNAKADVTKENVDQEEYTLSKIQEETDGKNQGRARGILNDSEASEAFLSVAFSKKYKEITKKSVLPDTLTGLVYQRVNLGDSIQRNFIPWEVYNHYFAIYNQLGELRRFFASNVRQKETTSAQTNGYYEEKQVVFVCESKGKKGKDIDVWMGNIDGEIMAKAIGEENLISVSGEPIGKRFAAKITKVAGKDGKVNFAEVKLLSEIPSEVDKELIPLSEIKFTLTDLEMLKTEYMEESSEKKVSVKKYDFKKNKEMKAYFKVLKGVLGIQVTDEIFLSWMQEKGYRSFINSPNMEESFILNREILQKYYKYLQNSRLFLTEMERLEQVYTDVAGARIMLLSVNEFEKKMKEANPRDEKNTVIRMVERFRVNNGKDCFTILKKNDAEDRVSIDWNAFDELRARLNALTEEE